MIARSDRRVLVLNGSHPLGHAMIRQLMASHARVTSVFPTRATHHQPHVHAVHGLPTGPRLQALLAVGEFDLIIQHMTSSSELDCTREMLNLLRKPTLVIVTIPHTLRVTFTTSATTPARLGVVRLPQLFGPNLSETQGWVSRAFTAAATGRTVPRPPDSESSVLYVEHAASAILDSIEALATTSSTITDLPIASMTRGQLYHDLVTGEDSEAIATTVAWFRQHPAPEIQDESLGRAA